MKVADPNNGGPAFPSPGHVGRPGMSVWDFFAAKAMAALIRQTDLPVPGVIANLAGKIADEMIAERARRRGE